jgi:sugar lactone lactonase YvrE
MKTVKFLSASFLALSLLLSACKEDTSVIVEPAPATVALQGTAVFPEGIITRSNGDIYVSGFGDGSIQKITNGTTVSSFSKTGENGMVIGVGMAIDEQRNRLWISNFNFKTDAGVPGSNVKVFDLTTGKLIKTLPEQFIPGVFFNEITIDKSGRVYISDTFNPQIWTASADMDKVEVFVKNDLLSNPAPDQPFDLNGLSITPDGKYLIASVMDRLDAGDGKLVRIDLYSKAVSDVKLTGDKAVAAFAGSDGMFFHNNQLFMVNVFSKAGAIITADFNADYSTANLIIRDKFQSVYDRPTASTVREGRLWTVNSQLNHIIDDNDGQLNTPAKTPFDVVHVSLADLLK